MNRVLRIAPLLSLVLSLGCQAAGADCDDPTFGTYGGKADGTVRTLTPGVPANGILEASDDEVLYAFTASAGATVRLEVTQAGSSRGLDTILRVFGPSGAGGAGDEIASDDEGGWGQLSEIEALEIAEDGDYLVQLTVDPIGDTDFSREKTFRLLLEIEGGTPDPGTPVADLPKEIHWVRNSAEYQAIVSQGYAVATLRIMDRHAAGDLPDSWAVVLDVDETIMSNSQYRFERATGVGTTWWGWVARREATLLPGAREFIQRVRTLGGTVALVTNRHVSQCRATADNLARVGVEYDVILCQDGDREKEGRWQSVENGTAAPGLGAAEIVMWVGDNIHDFRGMDQEHRHDASSFGDFGTRFIVMPNPMSGSWSSNPKL